MAVSVVPRVSKNWMDSSFNTHSFDFQWTIHDAKTRLAVTMPLDSPFHYPDFKVNGNKTKWQVRFDPSVRKETSPGVYTRYVSLQLAVSYCDTKRSLPRGRDIGVRAVIKFCILKPKHGVRDIYENLHDITQRFRELYVRYLPKDHNPSLSLIETANIKYGEYIGISEFARWDQDFGTLIIVNNTVTVYCKVDIYMLSNPMHKSTSSLTPLHEPAFNLGETIEEARKNNLFTDVTLVAGDKEFKAHRVVLASQSPFFKTRFEQHWQREDNKVEMSDLTSDILEAMISFMYTGNVPNTDTLAFQLLPAAEEYGLVGLRLLCERVLSDSLSSQNVIANIVLADTHNADGLKSACMSYITKNPSEAQKSEGWKQMKATKEHDNLRVEILETLANLLVK